MKKLTKVVSMLAAISALSSSFVACGKSGRKVDNTKTQFYIANFDGGYGHKWLDEAVRLFETRYAESEFEPGKKGVQVWVTNQKDEISGYNLYTGISGMQHDLFFTQDPRREILQSNLILSLEDIMDTPLSEFGESKTIRQKIQPYYLEQYPSNNRLVIPYAQAAYGNMVYDIDLFEREQFFFKEGGGWTGTGTKTVGMDGVAGTIDDGLPTNETDFFKLCDRIYSHGIIPVTFAGQYMAYANAWVFNLFENYDDAKSMKIYNTLQGDYTFQPGEYTETNGTKNVTAKTITFNGYNFYDAQQLPARLEALKIAGRFISNENYYSSEAFLPTQSHIEAQDEFITSVMAEDEGGQRVAMLIEGSWWESEASDTFLRMAKYDSAYAKKNRRLGLMPTFRLSSGTAQKTSTIMCSMGMFINANTELEDLAKMFIRFVYTDEVLNIFTRVTGCPMPCTYALEPETEAALTTFGRQLWEMHLDGDKELTDPTHKYIFQSENRSSPAYLANSGDYPQNFQTNVGSKNAKNDPNATFTVPFNYFNDKSQNPSAQKYFEGIYNVAVAKYDRYFAGKYEGANAR